MPELPRSLAGQVDGEGSLPGSYKRCTKCGECKSTDAFGPLRSGKGGLNPQCRVCRQEYSRTYREANGEKLGLREQQYREAHRARQRDYNRRYYAGKRQALLEQQRLYYRANIERISERNRLYREAHPESHREYDRIRRRDPLIRQRLSQQQRQYRQSNGDKISEAKRQYRENNREKVRETKRRYYEANRESLLAYYRRWCQANPDKVREQWRRWQRANRHKSREYQRRYWEVNAEKARRRSRNQSRRRRAWRWGAFVQAYLEAEIFDRDGWVCQLCGERIDRDLKWPHSLSPSIDHIIPLSRGGSEEPDNVQAAHLGCNIAKGNRVPHQREIAAQEAV